MGILRRIQVIAKFNQKFIMFLKKILVQNIIQET